MKAPVEVSRIPLPHSRRRRRRRGGHRRRSHARHPDDAAPAKSRDGQAAGSRLQQQGRQVSAERLYARAARQQPRNVEAQVARAVGLFDEDNLNPAFSRLGPLSGQYPRSQVVHYYLGYLLAWTAQGQQAISQFEKAVALGPKTTIGQAAKKFLEGIAASRGGS
jgi:predicted Zn-dependent protease